MRAEDHRTARISPGHFQTFNSEKSGQSLPHLNSYQNTHALVLCLLSFSRWKVTIEGMTFKKKKVIVSAF